MVYLSFNEDLSRVNYKQYRKLIMLEKILYYVILKKRSAGLVTLSISLCIIIIFSLSAGVVLKIIRKVKYCLFIHSFIQLYCVPTMCPKLKYFGNIDQQGTITFKDLLA